MTMKMMRERAAEKIRFAKLVGSDLGDYIAENKRTLETLWKEGHAENFNNDFLRVVNGYLINTGDYENVQVYQTLDLHCITATKKGVKALADLFFHY